MRFIDLFAGLGGFHIALRRLGHTCAYACEIQEDLRKTYKRNFRLLPEGDIRKVNIEKIPKHDILCAGFPCQPFSKAGEQHGLRCRKWGDLYGYVVKILEYHRPKYFILENVPNLVRLNEGRTWQRMKAKVKALGYAIDQERLSPHEFGIPQIRDRVYIVGCHYGLEHFEWPRVNGKQPTSILSALQKKPEDAKPLSKQVVDCIGVWQDFIKRFPKQEELPTFPIWSMEFGATYPFKKKTPRSVGATRLCGYRGTHGRRLQRLRGKELWHALPSYARPEERAFPAWKIHFIEQNRALYKRHRAWIDEWLPAILRFPASLQKLEWNCKGGKRNIWEYVIQFRASGVRVKRPTTAPSLVAMTTTQVPIIAWEKRYMTPRECARLQSMTELKHLPESSTGAFKALGNAVNANIVERVAAALLPSRARAKASPDNLRAAKNRRKARHG